MCDEAIKLSTFVMFIINQMVLDLKIKLQISKQKAKGQKTDNLYI